jgi:hypothetical protein
MPIVDATHNWLAVIASVNTMAYTAVKCCCGMLLGVTSNNQSKDSQDKIFCAAGPVGRRNSGVDYLKFSVINDSQ